MRASAVVAVLAVLCVSAAATAHSDLGPGAPLLRASSPSSRWQYGALQAAKQRLRQLQSELSKSQSQSGCIRRRSRLVSALRARLGAPRCARRPRPRNAPQLCAALQRDVRRARRLCMRARAAAAVRSDMAATRARIRYLQRALAPKPSVAPRPKW